MLLLVDQYSSGTVSSQTIHMSRELFMLPQWHVKTHNITYSSQLIVYLDLELVKNHCFVILELNQKRFGSKQSNDRKWTSPNTSSIDVPPYIREYIQIWFNSAWYFMNHSNDSYVLIIPRSPSVFLTDWPRIILKFSNVTVVVLPLFNATNRFVI